LLDASLLNASLEINFSKVKIPPIDFDFFPSDLGKYCLIGMESSLVPLEFDFNPEIKIEIINKENG
jgi:hypothetical protein